MPPGIRDWHPVELAQWESDCVGFHGEVLQGEFCHYCDAWDFLPIDETCCAEFSACTCQFPKWDMLRKEEVSEQCRQEMDASSEGPFGLRPTAAPQEPSISQDCPSGGLERPGLLRDFLPESPPRQPGSPKEPPAGPGPPRRKRT